MYGNNDVVEHLIEIGQADIVSYTEYFDTLTSATFPSVALGIDLTLPATIDATFTFGVELEAQIRYRGIRVHILTSPDPPVPPTPVPTKSKYTQIQYILYPQNTSMYGLTGTPLTINYAPTFQQYYFSSKLALLIASLNGGMISIRTCSTSDTTWYIGGNEYYCYVQGISVPDLYNAPNFVFGFFNETSGQVEQWLLDNTWETEIEGTSFNVINIDRTVVDCSTLFPNFYN